MCRCNCDPIVWINAGDLMKNEATGKVYVSRRTLPQDDIVTLISRGPGWVKHDGSVVCPVPGTMTEIYENYLLGPCTSDGWDWKPIKFYRVTANYNQDATVEKKMEHRIGYTATVEVIFDDYYETDRDEEVALEFPDGSIVWILKSTADSLEWKAPPPVLEVGKKALLKDRNEMYTISAIGDNLVLGINSSGDEWAIQKDRLVPLGDDEQ